jgi:hypothetical protein
MTDAKSRPHLPLVAVRSMAELLRRQYALGRRLVSAHGQGDRGREVSALPGGHQMAASSVSRREEAGQTMTLTPAVIECIVGIDVAKQAHVVCALEAPSGALRHKPSVIEATAEGYALLRAWLATWRGVARRRQKQS